MPLTDHTLRVVLYEGEGTSAVTAEDRFAAMTALLTRGFGVTRAGSARPVAPADASPVLVVGRWEGAPPATSETTSGTRLRWTSFDPATIADQSEAVRAELSAPQPGVWKPWFPVIDYDRCT